MTDFPLNLNLANAYPAIEAIIMVKMIELIVMIREFLNIKGILYPRAKAFSIAAEKLPVSTLTGTMRNLERDVSPVLRNARENIQIRGNIIEINTTEINSLLKILLMVILFLFKSISYFLSGKPYSEI